MSLEPTTAAEQSRVETPGRSADLDRLTIDTIRTLAIDAVEKANSGHAGAPMALAPVAFTLWDRFLRYDPAAPLWPNRDRFVLSNGHASMLLYALLYLAGVRAVDRDGRVLDRPSISLEDIENFRQLGSPTAGHPEHGLAAGIETTTGPLGQGIGNSVGMAIAARWLAARYNEPGAKLFDYNVYAICSDGDMMEGVGSEAASIAGHLRLANLCWIYDDNEVTIEGHTELAFTENIAERFRGYGWATFTVDDANDCEAFARAVESFLSTDDRPSLIIVKSVIGYGSPHKQGTHKAHSDPLGEEEVKLTKDAYGWPREAQFLVPDGVKSRLSSAVAARGAKLRTDWDEALRKFGEANKASAAELQRMWRGELPSGWDEALPTFPADDKGMATREASGKTLNVVAPRIPWLIGGSADLAPSTKTLIEGEGSFGPDTPGGRNLHFGVREHVMGSIANGLSVSNLRPYVGTFLIFSDYMRPPTRLAAMMELPVVYVFTHDSIGLGQDGPTHQPIEQLPALRAIPHLIVIRPCDANETVEAWRVALAQRHRPTALILSRQALPTLDRAELGPAGDLARGGYILAEAQGGTPEVILIATGSEIPLAMAARAKLQGDGASCRVVSLPSFELFEDQDQAWRDKVLPPDVTARVSVEAAAPLGWDRYVGPKGEIISMHSFGASAPGGAAMQHFGFTADHVVAAARRQIALSKGSRGNS
ncbi:MAG TPA: transketolase [Caulobacteraceae bacterium]|nr:transketolase [Caulobacteraceae bacterium]